jgi:hypothetical protein
LSSTPVRLISVAEAADRLNVSAQHFRREFINQGLVPVIPLGKGCKGDRICPQDLDMLIDQLRTRRCFTKEAKSGTPNLKLVDSLSDDPLGLPAKGRQKNSSESCAKR